MVFVDSGKMCFTTTLRQYTLCVCVWWLIPHADQLALYGKVFNVPFLHSNYVTIRKDPKIVYIQNNSDEHHVKPKSLTVLKTFHIIGYRTCPWLQLQVLLCLIGGFNMENCNFKLLVVECWWNYIIASRLTVNYQHNFSLLKNEWVYESLWRHWGRKRLVLQKSFWGTSLWWNLQNQNMLLWRLKVCLKVELYIPRWKSNGCTCA